MASLPTPRDAMCGTLHCSAPLAAHPVSFAFSRWCGRAGGDGRRRRLHGAPPRAASSHSVDIEDAAPEEGTPWKLGYQCNERYLKWDSSAQRQLIIIWVAQQLDIKLPELEERLAELALLLPDLDAKLDRLQAKLVLALVRDLPATTARILELRQLLPSLNLSALLAQYPWMLVDIAPQQVAAQLASLRAALPASVDVERLVAAEPMFLRANIQGVLAELRRLMPGKDPVALLLADPSGVLDMQSAGLQASLTIDDGIPAA